MSLFSEFKQVPETVSSEEEVETLSVEHPEDFESGKWAQVPSALSPFVYPPRYDDHSFWSPNLPEGTSLSLRHYLLGIFAPCLLGPVCSPFRRKDYIMLICNSMLWISMIQFLMFWISIAVGGMTRFSTNWTLGPPLETIYDMGAKSGWAIKHGQIHRLIVPIFLQGGFFHLVYVMVVQLMFLLAWERHWTIFRMLPIYWISGVGGYLLSCAIIPQTISVGATPCILGVVAAKMARTIVLWTKIIFQQRIANILICLILIVTGLLFTSSGNTDWASHIGGIIVGFFMGLMLWTNHIKRLWIRIPLLFCSMLALVIYFVAVITIFAIVPVKEPMFHA